MKVSVLASARLTTSPDSAALPSGFDPLGWDQLWRFGKLISCMKAWSERSSEFEPESIRQISRRTSKTERSARR
jgi:hypothetical protein